MSTIEDKILDGPRVHYCDADDDDIRDEDGAGNSRSSENKATSLFTKPTDDSCTRSDQVRSRISGSVNTGPKGVIEDFRRNTFSREQSVQVNDELEEEFRQLSNDDSFIKEYISKKISETINARTKTFGELLPLQTGTELLEAIDTECRDILVIVHIYTNFSKPCTRLNDCLVDLAKDMKHIKFVTLNASVAGLSENFKENGVPALLAYKGGNLVKSLVQLEELLDKDFDSSQVKELLIDNELTG